MGAYLVRMQPSPHKNFATTLCNLMAIESWREVTAEELATYGLFDTGNGNDISVQTNLQYADIPDPRPGEAGETWVIWYRMVRTTDDLIIEKV